MATVKETASRLQISVDTVYRLINMGRLHVTRAPGHPTDVVEEDIEALFGTVEDEVTDMLTLPRAAKRLGVSPEMVRRLVKDGQLPGYKYGPNNSPIRIPAPAVDAFKAASKMAASA